LTIASADDLEGAIKETVVGTAEDISRIVDENCSLYGIIIFAILCEHPELTQNPMAPADGFEILDKVVQEILDQEVPGWRGS